MMLRPGLTWLAGLACLTLITGVAEPAVAAQAATASIWETLVPAPLNVAPGSGAGWQLTAATRIVVDRPYQGQLDDEANLLASDLVTTGLLAARPQVIAGWYHEDVRPGDVWLSLNTVHGTNSNEAYNLDVAGWVVIEGRTDTGVFYGTRTLLQALTRVGKGGTVPPATVRDWPARPMRTVMLDNGRKYFSAPWIENLIRNMAWQKDNLLELHFSETGGFRIASDRYPQIVSTDGALTKAEVRQIIAVGKQYHVDVVPSVDSPGHLGQVLKSFPDLQVTRTDGTRNTSDLDYSKPAARTVVENLITEYASLFDSKYFNIGGDEFSSLSDPAKVPQLLDYARHEVGPGADVQDGYDNYQNELIGLLAGKGKTAIVYNNGWDNAKQLKPLDKRAIVDFWARKADSDPTAGQWLAAGYQLQNMDENLLYYVISPQFQGRDTGANRTPGWLYERWRPDHYIRLSFATSNEYEQVPAATPGQLGSVLAIWSDQPNYQTESVVWQRFTPWLGAYSARTWGSAAAAGTYQEFLALYQPLSTAPPAPSGG